MRVIFHALPEPTTYIAPGLEYFPEHRVDNNGGVVLMVPKDKRTGGERPPQRRDNNKINREVGHLLATLHTLRLPLLLDNITILVRLVPFDVQVFGRLLQFQVCFLGELKLDGVLGGVVGRFCVPDQVDCLGGREGRGGWMGVHCGFLIIILIIDMHGINGLTKDISFLKNSPVSCLELPQILLLEHANQSIHIPDPLDNLGLGAGLRLLQSLHYLGHTQLLVRNIGLR